MLNFGHHLQQLKNYMSYIISRVTDINEMGKIFVVIENVILSRNSKFTRNESIF